MSSQIHSDALEDTMSSLKKKLFAIKDVIGEGRFVYLDYPIHLNTGDILIMKGTEAFFSHFGLVPAVRKSVAAQSRVDGSVSGITDETTIVFHGGGNLGDLYPLHDNFRNLVIEKYPNNKIIILPQTLHFSSQETLNAASKRYRAHKNIHIFTRDHPSFATASKYLSDKVYLMPDMAHFLWRIDPKNPAPAGLDTLYLIRGDKESGAIPERFSDARAQFVDWNNIRTSRDVFFETLSKKMCAVDRVAGTQLLPATKVWYEFTDKFVGRQAFEFSKYKRIVTSRLHGHIFSTLLGIPNVLIDNSYGKNRNYYEAWTAPCGIAELC